MKTTTAVIYHTNKANALNAAQADMGAAAVAGIHFNLNRTPKGWAVEPIPQITDGAAAIFSPADEPEVAAAKARKPRKAAPGVPVVKADTPAADKPAKRTQHRVHEAPGQAPAQPLKVPGQPKEGSKSAAVLALLQRPAGATVAEIMAATAWGVSTARKFLFLEKARGITQAPEKREGQTVYKLTA